MSRLLQFEFRKVLRSKYLYILLAAAIGYVLLTGLTFVAISFIMKLADMEEGIEIIEELYDYDSYSFTKSAITGTFMMVVGVFVSIFACEDNGHGTSKNIVSKGYNRLQIYFSKYIASLVMVIGIALAGIIFAALFGLCAWGADSFANASNDNLAAIIIGELLCVVVFHSLFFMIAYSIGRTGPSIVINLLAPSGITLILAVGTILINKEGFELSDYWIDGILTNFAGSTDEKYFLSNFILLFVYYAASQLVGILVARRKQY